MPRWTRLLSALFCAVALSLGLLHERAYAVVVTCTNCGTEFTQLANNLQLIEQLARQAELVQEAVKRHQNMLLNSQGLDEQLFGDAMSEIKKVASLLNEAKSLSAASADLEQQFAEKYKDYNSYVDDKLNLDGLSDKYQQWSEDTNSSVLTTLKAAGLHAGQIEGEEDTLLKELEGKATTAEGRMQALQVANQIALASARQTQKLRQLMIIQLQLLANFVQTQNDRQAAEDAAFETFIESGRDKIKANDGKGF